MTTVDSVEKKRNNVTAASFCGYASGMYRSVAEWLNGGFQGERRRCCITLDVT